MTIPTTDPARNLNVPLGLALKEAAIAGAVAAALNFVFFYAARFFIVRGPLTLVDGPFPAVGLVPVLMFSILPALAAGLLYWGLDRYMANPNPAFLGISAIVFAGFLIGPVTSTDSAAVGWTLEIMHGIVAVPVIMAMLSLKAKV